MGKFWKDIDELGGKYAVARDGLIRNNVTHAVTKGSVDKLTGYTKAFLDGKTFLVHRLVAKAFIPNHDGLPQVHHIDGNKQNNAVENLEWVSRKSHGEKMTAEQKARFRQTYHENLKKRKKLKKVIVC